MTWLVRKPDFYKTLLMLAVPIVLQNSLSMGVGLADNVMVGQLGETAVSGVMVANQVNNIIAFLVMGISAALVILAAQYWGKEDVESVKNIISIAIRVTLAVGAFASVLMIFIPHLVLRIFTNEAAVIAEGVLYIRIIAFSYLFFCLTHTLIGAMRCVEVVRIGVVVSFSTLIISVSLNYLLIFGNFGFPEFGVRGAAIATLTARIIEAFIMVVYVRFVDKRLMLRFKDLLHTNVQLVKDFFKYGIPVVGGDVSWAAIGALKVAVLGRMGESAMAANSITVLLMQLVTVTVWSVAAACAVIIGKTVGSGDFDLVRQYTRTMQVIFVCMGVLAGLGIFALRDVFISIYNFTPYTQDMARQFMTIISISVVFSAYHAPCFVGIIRAGGDTKFVFIVDFLCSWLQVLPLTFIMAFVVQAPPWVVFLCIYSDQFYKWIIADVKTNRFKWIKNLTREKPA